MTKQQLFEDLERLKDKCRYAQYDAERIVEVIFQEAQNGASQLNPETLTDREIEEFLEKDAVVKKHLDHCQITISELVNSLGLRH